MRENRYRSACLFAAALLGTPTAAQTVRVVDDDGPADFDQVQAAVDASADGDLILVRAGDYAPFEIRDRSVTVLGEGAVTVTNVALPPFGAGATHALHVESAFSGTQVFVRGLHFQDDPSFDDDASVFVRFGDVVWLEDCSIAGAKFAQGHALELLDCLSVAVVRCDVDGPELVTDFAQGGAHSHGVRAVDSGLYLYDSDVRAGDGGPTDASELATGSRGGTGLSLRATTTRVAGSIVRGGDGSDAAPSCTNGPYDAGHGIHAQTYSLVRVLDSSVAGGVGGAPDPGCGGPAGADGSAFAYPFGALEPLAGTARGSRVDSPVRENTTMTRTFTGEVGDSVLSLIGVGASTGYDLAPLGVLHVDPLALFVEFVGVVPASGVLVVETPFGVLHPSREAAVLPTQGLFLDGEGGAHLSSPSLLVLLDERF